MSDKEGYHHGNLRAALLESAFDILVESGVEGLSLRGVARRAGVSPGAPYNHFKDKQAILSELAQSRRSQAAHAFVSAMEREETPHAKLRALGATYVGYALEHKEEFNLMFDGSLGSYARGAPTHVPLLDLFREVIGAADSRLSKTELDTAAITAWSLIHGLAQLLISGPLQELGRDPEQAAALIEQVMRKLGGLLESTSTQPTLKDG